jgi:hypothetical protein
MFGLFGSKKRTVKTLATVPVAARKVNAVEDATVYIEVYPAPTSTKDAPNFEFATIVNGFSQMLGGGNTSTEAAVDAGKKAATKLVGEGGSVKDTQVVIMRTFEEHLNAASVREEATFSKK